MTAVQQVGSFFVDLAINCHDGGVHLGIGDEVIGRRSTLSYQISSEDSVTCAIRGSIAALIDIRVFISDLQGFVVIVVEE